MHEEMREETLRCWAEVDLDEIAYNYRTLMGNLPAGCDAAGIVKADAYGHGAVHVGRCLEQLGCSYLAVATIWEAEELRKAGIKTPILCLGHTPPELMQKAVQLDMTQTIGDLETAKEMEKSLVALGRN